MSIQTAEPLVCSVCCATYRSGFERCPRDGAALAKTDQDPVIGLVIDGRYRIERRISDGAMGRVYLANHARLSRRFAVKILFGELAAQETMRARFRLEAEAASRLEHRNLCSVVDFGESEQGLLYIVMEFIEGRTLDRILKEEGTFTEERAIRMAHDLCRGLRHLHARGLIHRDLKLENVVVVPDRDVEVPKIVDFGIALVSSDPRLTRAGAIVGTPAFMAPEQAFGDKVDARADLFSLGIVLYHLLTGTGPFAGTSFEIIQQTVTNPVPPMSSRNPHVLVTPELEQLVMRLLARHPDDRFASAQAVIEALDALPGKRQWSALSNLTPLPEFNAAGEAVPPGSRKKRALWIGGAAAVGLLGGALAVLFGAPERKIEERRELAAPPAPTPPPAIVEREPEPEPEPPPPRAAPKKKTRRVRSKKVRPVENKMMPLGGDVDAKTRTTPEPAVLAARYQRVGKLIERLAEKRGSTRAASYRLRHVAIPLPASLKTDSERTDVAKQIAQLQRDVEAELGR